MTSKSANEIIPECKQSFEKQNNWFVTTLNPAQTPPQIHTTPKILACIYFETLTTGTVLFVFLIKGIL